MKKIALLGSVILALFSCKKETNRDPIIIIEPPDLRIIAQDTIMSGNFREFAIGQSPEQVYATIQNTRVQRQIKYLGIVNNNFTNITALESRVDLYTQLFLYEASVFTPDDIQIYFEEDKIKSIYTRNGNKLSQWPAINNTFIKTGDPLSSVYNKLLAISNISQYSAKFKQMSLTSKNIEKGYDINMSLSSKWELSSAVTDKIFWHVELNFSNGSLLSIYATHYEYY